MPVVDFESSKGLKRVAIESPFAGDVPRNVAYLLACMRFCLQQGVSPYAGHLQMTFVLNDKDKEQRKLGMKCGFAHADQCDERWLFHDLGFSAGMKAGAARGEKRGQTIRTVTLGKDWSKLIANIPQAQIDALVLAVTHG